MIEKLLETQIIDGYKYKNIELILLSLSQRATEKELNHIPKGLLEDKGVKKLLVEMGMLCVLGQSKQVVTSNFKYFNMVLLNNNESSYVSKKSILKEALKSTVIMDMNDYLKLDVSSLREIEVFDEYQQPKNLESLFQNRVFIRINDLVGFKACKIELFNLIVKNPDDSKELMEVLSLQQLFGLQKFLEYKIWDGLFNIHQNFNPQEHGQSNLDQMEKINIENDYQLSSMVNYYFKRPSENLLMKINKHIDSSENYVRLNILNQMFKRCEKENDLGIFSGYKEFEKNQEVNQEVETITFKISAASLMKSEKLERLTISSIAKKIQEMISYGQKMDNTILESICGSMTTKNSDIYVVASKLNIQEQKELIKMFIDFIVINIETLKVLDEEFTMKLFNEKYLNEVIPKSDKVKRVMKF